MSSIKANEITIEYDTFGDPASPPLLLIAGISCQMIAWSEKWCKNMAKNGFYVIRFDNRDIGLSEKFEHAGLPNVSQFFKNIMSGKPAIAPYSLDDMADDAIGLLDALKIEKAHICGFSMGGMIAQAAAIHHPERLRSLISIYSSTGNPVYASPSPDAVKVLFTPPPKDFNEYIEYFIDCHKTLSGPGFPFDEKYHRELAKKIFERSTYSIGVGRQFLAIVSHGDRASALKSVQVPALIIHGKDDPLVPVNCGEDTAKAIANSELILIEGMGHDLPHKGAWVQIADDITTFAKKVEKINTLKN